MQDKYLSVITNFGCHYSCPYCIVKNNNLNIPKTTVKGLGRLHNEILNNHVNWVSISGGGDPLWEYESHKPWWKGFFRQVPLSIHLELHTSILNIEQDLKEQFDRIVYHLHTFEQLKYVKRSEDEVFKEIVRVVFVVTENFTEDLIDKIAEYCKESPEIDELSFHQMVDDHYKSTNYCAEYLRAGHKDRWWYIEQCDYNLYYCENKIYTEYHKIGEEL